MTNLTIAGETFHVRIEGEETNPVLMLSNSLGTTLRMWEPQMPALLKHFRVIRYDSRGHGGSVSSPGPYSIAQLGRDALAILDALEIEQVHWLGLSKGGAVGQWLLINAPERIERAVLANTAARFGTPDGWNSRITLVLEGGMEAVADWTLERWFSDDFLESNDPHLDQIHKDVLATPPRGYAACCAALRDLDLREGLRGIEHPVLVIAGAHDPATPPAQTGLIASAIAHAKLVTLNTRHISNIEDPEGFTKAVLDFLLAKTAVRRAPARKMPPPLPAPRRIASRRLPARGQTGEAVIRRAPAAQASAAKASPVKAAVPKASTAKPGTIKLSPAAKTSAKAAPKKNAPASARAKPAPRKPAAATKEPAKTARKAAGKTARKPAAAAKAPLVKAKAKPAPAAKTKPASKAAAGKTPAKVKSAAKVKPGAKVKPAAKPKASAKVPKRPVKMVKKPAPRRAARAVNRT